ncbi:MAG: hypothetical protein V4689_19665 [Verrucomicrobiota bacterium]
MKINSAPLPSTSVDRSRLAKLGRLFMAVVGVSLVSVAATPKAQAAAPNGVYEFESATGSFTFDGETIDLPPAVVKRVAGFVKGEIIIEKRTLQLNRSATKKVVRELADEFDAEVTVSVSGPTSLTLTRDGDAFFGSARESIVTSFEGSYRGGDFSGVLNTDITAKVQGKALRVIIRFTGGALDSEFSGKLVIIARR